MLDWLFKQPWAAWQKGELLFASGLPGWLLAAVTVALAAALAAALLRARSRKRLALFGLQAAFVFVLLLMLWRPAIGVSTLKPQANVIAVLVDDSASMAVREEGSRTRLQQAVETLDGGLLRGLRDRFQVRLYRFSDQPARVEQLRELQGAGPSSRIGDALAYAANEGAGVPVGAVVLLSDGADNSGAVSAESLSALRRARIPVHTVGYGRERASRDIEITEAAVPHSTLPGARVVAQVGFRSTGYPGRRARLTIREASRVLASQDVELKDGEQSVPLSFSAGEAGARALEITAGTLPGEENAANNRIHRLLAVDPRKPRILYVEGEPRWEYKFIRRALEDDRAVEVVSMLRTTQNKLYRQGVASAEELQQGFPLTAEELFAFDGLILGSVESGWFTPAQQDLIREFAERRGGGVLFLGGRSALGDGGFASGPLADLLPVSLPKQRGTFRRENATARLTDAGIESAILRLVENPGANAERWKTLPALADYQEVGAPKPAATVLAQFEIGRTTGPLLAIQNYGRGRSAVLATGGTWRWQMRQDSADQTHEVFWRQLLRWLVADTPGQVSLSTPRPVLSDETRLPLRAEVRDKAYRPVNDARVEARVVQPDGTANVVDLQPKVNEPGVYAADWTALPAGSYLAEVTAARGAEEIGRHMITVRRENGVAENFRIEQNRPLLERLSEQTGGRYYRPAEASKLARDIEFSEAGISVRETRDLWDMPALLLLALALRSAEWLLRRRWGTV